MPHIQNLTQKDYIEFLPDGLFVYSDRRGGRGGRQEQHDAGVGGTLSEQDIKDVIAFIRTLPTY